MNESIPDTSLTCTLQTIQQIYKLKDWRRTGWLRAGISELDCESVAAHSFGVALLALLVEPLYLDEDLDWSRVQKMAILHDMGEAIVGDITPYDGITLEDKFKQEKEAVEKLSSAFPQQKELRELWLEFEADESSEGHLVRQLDKLDRLIQADIYEQTGHSLDDFFQDMSSFFKNSPLEPIFNTLMQLRAERKV